MPELRRTTQQRRSGPRPTFPIYDQPINSGVASREAAREMLDRALGAEDGTDSPAEAYARDLIRRGRPSLTAPGVHSKARQVRLPDNLDASLERYVAMTHTSRSEVIRIALEEYLRKHTTPATFAG